MRKLVILLASVAIAAAYRDGRRSAMSAYDDFPPYRGPRQHPPFHEQHQPFREQSYRPQQYQSYRHRPYRQDVSTSQQSFDQSLLRDFPAISHRPFYNGPSFKDESSSKQQLSFYGDAGAFKDQQFRDETAFKNQQGFEDQSAFNDQYAFQQQPTRHDHELLAGAVQSHPENSYGKPMNSYNDEQPTRPSMSFMNHADYLKYGNHGLGFASVPTISPYENALPLNEETSTATAPTATHKPLLQSTVSSTSSAITQVHTSTPSKTKLDSAPTTTQSGKSATLADVPATASTKIVPTLPTVPVTGKQSSNLADSSAALTTDSSLAVRVTEAPITSFGGKLPMQFDRTKLTAALEPSAFYIPEFKRKLQQSAVEYLLALNPKNAFKHGVESTALDYIVPELPNNSLNNKIPVLNYVLPEDSKNALKSSLQTSLLNYLIQQGSKNGLPFQQSSLPETLNYVPLTALSERSKLSLQSIPIATLSAVSRPMQTINYASTTLPKVSFMTSDSSAPGFPLATQLNPGLPSGVAENQPGSIFNNLAAGITGSLSGNVLPGMLESVPSLNLGHHLQHVGQVQQFQPARNQPYSTGLQLQLGGFGGIDYSLHSGNPSSRPMELGIAKVGLSLPELPRVHVPTFAKVGYGQQLW